MRDCVRGDGARATDALRDVTASSRARMTVD
jgi:hypothetical protein